MIIVAVLRGGPGDGYDISLRTGAYVLKALERVPYQAIDVFIDKQGTWHVRGVPTSPDRVLAHTDVVFNALHCQYGEDGTVQRLLDRIGIPYTGSDAYGSGVAMNKALAKDILQKEGVLMPRHKLLKVSPTLEREAREAFRAFAPPMFIKPVSSGLSAGVSMVKTFEQFWAGVKKAFQHATQVLVEEYIKGKEATAGVIQSLRASPYYQLLPVGVVLPSSSSFFDYDAKYSNQGVEHIPGHFTKEESAELKRLANIAHDTLGLGQYSRSDFIVSPRGIYFLESNTLPTLTRESSFSKSLNATGISMDELLDHIIKTALEQRRH